MNEFLAAKTIDMRQLIGYGRTTESVIHLDGGRDLHLSTKFDLSHFKVSVEGSEIFFDSSSSCYLKKIKAGLFKGCYCIIEKEGVQGKKMNIYVLADKFFKLAETKGDATDKEINDFFNREYIEKLTAKKLNHFDITHQTQGYKLFCDKLPKSVLRDEKFFTNVMKYFFALGDVEFAQKTNIEFINKDMCKSVAFKYLDNLAKSARKDDQETSI